VPLRITEGKGKEITLLQRTGRLFNPISHNTFRIKYTFRLNDRHWNATDNVRELEESDAEPKYDDIYNLVRILTFALEAANTTTWDMVIQHCCWKATSFTAIPPSSLGIWVSDVKTMSLGTVQLEAS
jgi:hypothetical protein